MIVALGILAFILGSIIGSFLNVVVLRMNTGKNLGGRSSCPHCKTQLKWYELVPIVSWLIQKGKCRTCKAKISSQYVLVESGAALLFAGVALKFAPLFINGLFSSFILYTILWMILVSIGVVIAAYDIKYQLIDVRALFGLACACIVLGFLDPTHIGILSHIIGAVIVPLPFLVLWLLSKGRLIGFGDIEIMAATGFLFGPTGGFSSVTLGFWAGSIIAISVVAYQSRKGNKETPRQIAFAPFLLLGIYLVGILGFDIFARILGMM
ncbi:MAG: prepilin peptidase leader peptidase (prepilin peptidase) / N-methyltransferase [Patescibacteria group bacterium]|nr:prepilin peptidase leader peptidase (prepilin peptidase) / N-methyltransferase [Patescibacteria group bacterium]